MKDIVTVQKETSADIITCSEHNLDTTQYNVRSTMYYTCKKELSTPQLQVSSTPIDSKSTWKPGGTFTLSTGPITARKIDEGSDTLGRWSYQTFAGKHGIRNTIISCYNTPKQHHTVGKFTNYSQQVAYLRKQNRSVQDIRKLFYSDLSNFLKELEEAGHDYLIIGDFNDDLVDINSGMAKILNKHGLHDLMHHVVGDSNIPTYGRGKQRLDYALGTDRFLLATVHGGYEQFGARVPTDHRPYFLDFDTKKLFGIQHLFSTSHDERFLRSNDIKRNTKYLASLHKKLTGHNIFNRMQELFDSDVPNHQLLEQLDDLITNHCLKVEQDCKRKYNDAWSRALLKERAAVSIYKYYISMYLTKLSHHTSIDYLQEEYGTVPIPSSLKEAKLMLQKARVKLNAVIKDSVTTREQEIRDKIEELELIGTKDAKKKGKNLLSLLRSECLKQLYRKISNIRQKKQGKLHHLEVPINSDDDPKEIADNQEKWKILDTSEEIYEALKRRNIRHFGQSELDETPFFCEPLKSEINYTATDATAEAILEGDYDNDLVDDTTIQLIKALRKETTFTASAPLPRDEFLQRIKLWDENTTTSPSGLHLGHWKVLLASHDYSTMKEDDPQKQEYDKYQSDLITLRLNIINYCIKWGYSLSRWKKVVTRMIMKEPGNFKIHRLRVIHLYEADYSLLLAIHWRKILHNAEDNGNINDGTYGSRPKRSAITPPFIEEMMLEISRAARKLLIMFDNDATSCYDRIVTKIMSMVSQHFGGNRQVLLVWATTLEEARYHIKTNNKVSEEFYQHCQAFPIHGSGQGATNSPCGWLFISSKLFDIYDETAHGATFYSPDKKSQVSFFMIGFVDDTKNQVNDFLCHPQPSLSDMLPVMQSDAQLWNDLLWSSGGALELPKCSYQVVEWFFHKGYPYMEGGKPRAQLELHNSDGDTTTIKPLSAYTAHKTLGHYKSPNGSMSSQYLALEKKCKTHTAFIQGNRLSRREVWIYYYSMYLPSMTFPLGNSFFTRQQLESLEKPTINAVLSKTGMSSKTHRSIIYGPKKYAGRAYRSLYGEQGTLQIKQVLMYSRRNDTSGKILFLALQWAQYNAGVSEPLLHTSNLYKHLEVKWIAALHQFLVKNKMAIEYSNTYVMPLQRENDRFIMDIAIAMNTFTVKQLEQINHVCLFLQILTVADFTSADGLYLLKDFLYKGSPQKRKTKYVTVTQEDPPSESWTLFYEVLGELGDANGKLYFPLGDWLIDSKEIRMISNLYYSKEFDSVFDPTTLMVHPTSNIPERILDSLPQDSIPIDDIHQRPKVKAFIPSTNCNLLTFEQYLMTLPPWEILLFDFVSLSSENMELLLRSINNNDIVLASDGSVVKDTGTFGWLIATRSTEVVLVKGSGWVSGTKPSSYRAEIYGGLAIARFLLHLCKFYQTDFSYKPIWWCDNSALVDEYIKWIDSPAEHSGVLAADWDVLHQLVSPSNNGKLQATWIKSHQDRTCPLEQLQFEAQMNCMADKLAEAQHSRVKPTDLSIVPVMETVSTQLIFNGNTTVTSRYARHIRHQLTADNLFSYIVYKNNWNRVIQQYVSWEVFSRLNKLQENQSTTYTKHVHRCLPINQFLHRINEKPSPICSCCKQEDETQDHLPWCSATTEWRNSYFTELDKAGRQLVLDPEALHVVRAGLSQPNASSYLDSSHYPTKYREAIRQQNRIGWGNWYRAIISKEWIPLLTPLEAETITIKSTVSILKITTQHWRKLWNLRNEIEHGRDTKEKNKKKRELIIWELEKIYQDRLKYLAKDQDLLFEHIRDHKAQSTCAISNWLHVYGPIFRSSKKESKEKSLQGVRKISDYFGHIR